MYKKCLMVLILSAFGLQIRAMDDDIDADDIMEALRDSLRGIQVSKDTDKKTAKDKELENAREEAKQFNQKMLNTKINTKGHTALHILVMHPEEMSTECPDAAAKLSAAERVLATYDQQRAKQAAARIKMGAKIDIKDGSQKTVCDIAEKNKTVLPHIYKVIMAGRTIQDYDAQGKNEIIKPSNVAQANLTLDKYAE